MQWLDRISTTGSPTGLVLVLALAGCSDDGFAPPIDTDAGTTSGSGVDTLDGDTGAGTTGPLGTTADPGDSTGGGGSSSTGGTTEGDGSTTMEEPPPSTMCEMANQCVLIDNCCECAAYHMDDPVPLCDIECDQPMCSALGIADIGLVCEEGMCGLELRDCSGLVACDSLPPDCPEGTLPEVGMGGGGCWTGSCVPLAACDPVPGCEYCDADEACVENVGQQGITYSCKAVPEACEGMPTCACMPPDTCQMNDVCADVDGGLQCSCPMC